MAVRVLGSTSCCNRKLTCLNRSPSLWTQTLLLGGGGNKTVLENGTVQLASSAGGIVLFDDRGIDPNRDFEFTGTFRFTQGGSGGIGLFSLDGTSGISIQGNGLNRILSWLKPGSSTLNTVLTGTGADVFHTYTVRKKGKLVGFKMDVDGEIFQNYTIADGTFPTATLFPALVAATSSILQVSYYCAGYLR